MLYKAFRMNALGCFPQGFKDFPFLPAILIWSSCGELVLGFSITSEKWLGEGVVGLDLG